MNRWKLNKHAPQQPMGQRKYKKGIFLISKQIKMETQHIKTCGKSISKRYVYSDKCPHLGEKNLK